MLDFWFISGLFTIFLGLMVGPTQLFRIIKTKEVRAISKNTYAILVSYQFLLEVRAIYVGDWVFILTNGLGMLTNGMVLVLLYYYGRSLKQ